MRKSPSCCSRHRAGNCHGIVPEGIGGTTKAVGDAVRILASLSYSLFKKDPGSVAELAASFLKFAEAETPKRETEARLGRLFKHLKLARDFDLLATGLISTSIIAETAVQNTRKRAARAPHWQRWRP